ncbi:MAG TPA: hypothetical protein VF765_23590 [Polyangiaceae bacterium]
MYRAPDAAPRCVACGETQLAGPTWFTVSEGFARVYFEKRGAKPGFLGGSAKEGFHVNRARVCLACGHVMLGLSDDQLQQLRDKLGTLQPMEGM